MTSHDLNILVAVAIALAGTTDQCSNCAIGAIPSGCQGCQGMEASHSSPPCAAGLSCADRQSHRCPDGLTVSGLVTDRVIPASDSDPNHVGTAGFPATPEHLTAADKPAGVSRGETLGGVFLVLDGSSIPIALQHLLF